MKKTLSVLLSFIFMMGLVSVVRAEEAVNKVSVGGDIRIRGQYTKNDTDLDDDSGDTGQLYRQRTRLWVKGELEEGYTGYVRVTAEPRWGRPDYDYNKNHSATLDPNDNNLLTDDVKVAPHDNNNNIVIDNAYLEAKDFLGTPVTLKIGRQDMTYGEGFMIFDGTPADGSRTIYFDAIKLSGSFSDINVDLFTAKVKENDEVTPDDEDFYGLYFNINTIKDYPIDVYALHRAQNDEAAKSKTAVGKNNTTALGVRSTGKIIENLTYAVEFAKQFGKYDENGLDMDRDAMGALAHVTYAMPEVTMKPSLKFGLYYTSGNDNDTNDKYEAWDNFYSEFPKYGYGDGLANLTKIDSDEATWTNFMIYELDLKLKPTDKMTTSLGYLYMTANEQNNAEGKDRVSCPQAKVDYNFTKAVSGTLAFQYMQIGDYYDDKTDTDDDDPDDALYAKCEMNIKF